MLSQKIAEQWCGLTTKVVINMAREIHFNPMNNIRNHILGKREMYLGQYVYGGNRIILFSFKLFSAAIQ